MAQKKESKKPKKLAIVGCADSKLQAPFGNPDFEIWGVNNLYVSAPIKHFSKWFEIHYIHKDAEGKFMRRYKYEFRGKKVEEYLKELAGLKIPVYMQRLWPEVPNGILYPLDKVLKEFSAINGFYNHGIVNQSTKIDLSSPDILQWSPTDGMTNVPRRFSKGYFTNTISYMICLGILEGFKEIHVYGVDMAVGTEYECQRSSCEFFLGWAAGLGIKIFIPQEADLLKTRHLYAFEEPRMNDWTAKTNNLLQSMEQRKNEADNQCNQLMADVNKLTGGIETLETLLKDIKGGIAGDALVERIKAYIAGNAQLRNKQDFEAKIARKKFEQYIGAITACKEEQKIWG